MPSDSVAERVTLRGPVLIGFAYDCVPSGQSQNRYLQFRRIKSFREARFFEIMKIRGRSFLTKPAEDQGVSEFYKKGCQGKTSASTGGRVLCLDLQPTV